MMSTNDLKSLPKETVRLIGSSQVITSVYSVVKELLENSFDAESTSVDIKLENYGFDKIEIRDNGTGIKKASIPLVAQRYHTSKITSFEDLGSLSTFGFRGEALGSLCAVSTLSITSKTATQDVSHMFSFDHHGNVISEKPSHLGQGTTILASNLFSNMPVRRQYYKSVKKKKEEMKRIEDLCMAYGAIRPSLRLILKHNKDIVWQKNPMQDTRTALISIFGRNVFSQLEYKAVTDSETKMTVEAYLPKAGSEVAVTSRSTNDRGFIAVNGRPVQFKELDKCVRQYYSSSTGCDGRHPIYCINLSVPVSDVDVNIDPNKTRVMLHQQKQVMEALSNLCEDVYGPVVKSANRESDTVNTREMSSPNCSFTQSNDSLNSRDRNPVNEAISEFVAVTKLTEKYGNTVREKIGMDNDSENLDQADNLFTDSFHSIQTSEIEPCVTKTNNIHVVGDSSDSLTIANSLTDGNGKETGDVKENMDFDVLDPDLKHLLSTQKNTDGVTDVDTGFDIEQYFNDSNDVFGKSLEISAEKENVKKSDEFMTESKLASEDSDMVRKNCEAEGKDFDQQWSKGKIQVNGDHVLQPVQLLMPGANQALRPKRPPSPDGDLELIGLTPPAKKRAPCLQVDQPRIYEVSSNSGDKLSTGFVAFSKQIRPKVVTNHPDEPYDEITAMVRQRWDKLTDEEREEFHQTGTQQVQELRKLVTSKSRLNQKIDRRIVPVKGLPSIKDQLLLGSLQTKGLKKSIPIKSVKVAFSISKLQDFCKQDLSQIQTQMDNDLRLIGPLKYYNGWLCRQGNKLKLINPHRVEETLLHRELMEDHQIPATRLEHPQPINECSIGGHDNYQALVDMVPTDSHQTYVYIEDKRLTANGMQVRCHLDQHGKTMMELVGISTAMPQYSMADLQEVLELIVKTRATSVFQSRPLKVAFYLQGEAVRMVRQRPVQRSREDMCDLLQQMVTSLPADCVECLHNKPFLHTIYNMEDIPMTQSQT